MDAKIETIGGTIKKIVGLREMAKRAKIDPSAMKNRILGPFGSNSFYHLEREPKPCDEGNNEWKTLSMREPDAWEYWTYSNSFDAGTMNYRASVSSMRAQQAGNLWRSGAILTSSR